MRIVWLLVVALGAAGLLLVLASQLDGLTEPAAQDGGTSPAGEAVRLEGEAGDVRARVSLPASPDKVAMVKGVCVDATTKVPLAGCVVCLQLLRDTERMQPAEQLTGKDGRFTLAGVPPPAAKVQLLISRKDLATAATSWEELKLGSVTDLGRIPLQPGSQVSGVVVDTEGRAQPGVSVTIYTVPESEPEGWDYFRWAEGESDIEGRLQFRGPLLVGRYRVVIRHRDLRSANEFPVQQGVSELRVVVASYSPAGQITGMVVDEAGKPLHKVCVDYSPSSHPSHAYTGEDGTFLVRKRDRDPRGPVTLRFDEDCYEIATAHGVRWGTTGLRVVLRRGVEIELHVWDARSGQPVEDYGVICYQTPGTSSQTYMSSGDYEVRYPWKHQGGRLVIRGIRRGRTHLTVVPATDKYAIPAKRSLDLTGDQRVTITERLWPPARRALEVLAAGKPVAGTKVQLIEPVYDAPVDCETWAVSHKRDSLRLSSERAWLIHEATTNKSGCAELVGAPNATYSLRLNGPGHQPIVLPEIRLDPAAGPLVVKVPLGATVKGRLRPLSVLRELGDLDGKEFSLGVLLLQPPSKATPFRVVSFPYTPDEERDNRPLDEKGNFEVRSIPPGEWILCLVTGVSSDGIGCVPVLDVGRLEEGQRRLVDIDVSHLRPARLKGRVMLDGKPVTDSGGFVTGIGPGLDGRMTEVWGANIDIDSQGRFEVKLLPARYSLELFNMPGDRQWQSGDEAVLSPGSTVSMDFTVVTGGVRLRLLQSDGKTPVTGVSVWLDSVDRKHSAWLAETDKRGQASDTVVATTYELWICPNRLRAEAANWSWDEEDLDTVRQKMISLGRLTVSPGLANKVHDIIVPREAGY